MLFGLSSFVRPIADEMGWSYVTISSAFSLRNVELGLVAPVAGILTDRYGPRKVVLSGGALAGVGLLLLSRMDSLTFFYLGFVVLSVGVSGCANVVITCAVANWFQRRMGIALGLASSGIGFGGALMPAIVWLMGVAGWRQALALLGVGTFLVILPLACVLRHDPERYGYSVDDEPPSPDAATGGPVIRGQLPQPPGERARALRSAAFWLVGGVFALHFMAFSALMSHVMPYFASVGVAEKTAALTAMFIPVSGVIGRLSLGWLSDRMNKRYLVVACSVTQALAFAFLLSGRAPWQLSAFILLYGPAAGAIVVLRTAVLVSAFGRESLGFLQGFLTTVMTLGGVVGPVYAGWVFDRTRSYDAAWITFALALLACIPLVLAVRRPRPSVTLEG